MYIRVPTKTKMVPIQCQAVKGFRKYRMEMIRLTNLRNVTTNVTVREVHSVVKMKTPRMQTYLRKAPELRTHTNGTFSLAIGKRRKPRATGLQINLGLVDLRARQVQKGYCVMTFMAR